MTGQETPEQRHPERERLGWIRENPLLVGAGVATAALVGLALILAVFGSGEDEEASVSAPVSPTAQDGATATGQDSGLSPVPGEPTFTDTGLGIIDIEAGTGETPQSGQVLVVHYTGWLSEDGSKFDSSLDRGTPIEFVLGAGQVIDGWDEGLATMQVGGKRRLIIPAELAYGELGRAPVIPPNAELTFDVELLEIKESP